MVKTTLVPGVAWIDPEYKAGPNVFAPCNEHKLHRFDTSKDWDIFVRSVKGKPLSISDMVIESGIPRTCVIRRVRLGLLTKLVDPAGTRIADNGRQAALYRLGGAA